MKPAASRLLVGLISLAVGCGAQALPIVPTDTIASGGSSLVLKVDDAAVYRRPFTLDLTIDGRNLIVYSSQPADQIGSFHHLHKGGAGTHIESNQIHLGGSLVGTAGTRSGLVYTLTRTGELSRLTEKVDLVFTTGTTFRLTGLGASQWTLGDTFATRHGYSNAAALPTPDLSGWEVTGSTLVFSQTGSLVEGPPYAPFSMPPVVAFNGFNTFDRNFSVTGCSATTPCQVTMITELNITRVPLFDLIVVVVVILLVLLAGGAAFSTMRRRRAARAGSSSG